MADKYLSAAGKRRRLYINTIKVFDELMANICRQKTSSDYSCHSKHTLTTRGCVIIISQTCAVANGLEVLLAERVQVEGSCGII